MSIVADQLRPFWLAQLNEVSGKLEYGLAEWMRVGTYQVTMPLQSGQFVLDIPYGDISFQRAVAYDLARMGMAAFESISDVQPHPTMPKSMGWTIIKTYYSAFFAAHALLRSFGISLSQLDAVQINHIQQIASLYGSANGQQLSSGFYLCVYDPVARKLTCTHEGKNGGSHEVLWKYFLRTMFDLSNKILMVNGNVANQQQAAAKLTELCDCLKHNGKNTGTWLSFVRNQTNYRHELGAWYPYKARANYYLGLSSMRDEWRKKPEEIVIWSGAGRDLQRFIGACNLILAIQKSTTHNMSKRCPTGKSFQLNTIQAVLNLLELSAS